MKKILAVILACVIVAAFTACSADSSSQGGETSSSQSESESSASDRVKVEDEELTNLIKNLNDTVQPGSAGSSLKAATAARDFIRWADGCELTDGDIEKVVTEALSSYDDTEKGTFFEAWSLVKSSYETIKAGGDDAAELLQSAGVEGEVTVSENADKAFSALDSAINTVVVSTEE